MAVVLDPLRAVSAKTATVLFRFSAPLQADSTNQASRPDLGTVSFLVPRQHLGPNASQLNIAFVLAVRRVREQGPCRSGFW